MEKETKQLNTVHENDLDNAFNQLGIKEDFENNKLHCKFCGKVVNKENIYSILPESSTVNLICDDPKCVTSLMEYLEEKNKIKVDL